MNARAALAVAAIVLAGCAAPADDVVPEAQPERMLIEGIVQTTSFEPIAGALVRVADLNATTGADGAFHFDLVPSFYILNVTATGFLPLNLTLTPEAGVVPVDAQLVPVPAQPFHETVHLRGHIQCAAEYVIISGGCDAALTSDKTLGMDPVFSQDSALELDALTGWKTLVADVSFDPEAQPGLDGLRVVVQGVRDQSEVLTYEQYGRFHGSTPFSFLLEPGAMYEEGEREVPLGQTAFRLEVFPHSHGWHSTCEATCLLGVGADIDVDFDLYVTVFYLDPAPAGWSLL